MNCVTRARPRPRVTPVSTTVLPRALFAIGSFPATQQGRGVRQVGEDQVRIRGGEFLARVPTRGDGGHADADAAGALNVERRVANDPAAIELDPAVQVRLRDLERLAGDVVAVEVVV